MTQDAIDEIVKQSCDRINKEELPLFATVTEEKTTQALLGIYRYMKVFKDR